MVAYIPVEISHLEWSVMVYCVAAHIRQHAVCLLGYEHFLVQCGSCKRRVCWKHYAFKESKKKNLVILGSACACVGMLVTKHTTIILTAVGSVEDYRFINELLIISF